jgi:hypothetical protein
MSPTKESTQRARKDQVGLLGHEAINLKPFAIEPILLARLNNLGLRPTVVGIATAFIILLATVSSALIDNTFFRPLSKTSTTSDL